MIFSFRIDGLAYDVLDRYLSGGREFDVMPVAAARLRDTERRRVCLPVARRRSQKQNPPDASARNSRPRLSNIPVPRSSSTFSFTPHDRVTSVATDYRADGCSPSLFEPPRSSLPGTRAVPGLPAVPRSRISCVRRRGVSGVCRK